MHLGCKANADTLAKMFKGQKVHFKILRSLLVNDVGGDIEPKNKDIQVNLLQNQISRWTKQH